MFGTLLSNARERWGRTIVAALIVGALSALLAVSPWGMALDRIAGLEWLYALRGPVSPPGGVVVVNMSKRSIDRLGLPRNYGTWPRAMHADLVRRLAANGAAVIVLDIFFRENRIRKSDLALARAIADSGRTILFQRVERDTASSKGSKLRLVVTDQLLSPIDVLSKAAAGMGPFPLPKVPARVDQFWTFNASVGDVPTIPVVALQLLILRSISNRKDLTGLFGPQIAPFFRSYLKSAKTNEDLRALIRELKKFVRENPVTALPNPSPIRKSGSNGSGFRVPIRDALQSLLNTLRGPNNQFINYYGPPGTIKTIPYYDVIQNRLGTSPDLDVSGKVVFVGLSDFTSTDTKDGFHTVYSRKDGIQLSGVEIIATAFANLLQGHTLYHPDAFELLFTIFAFGVFVTTIVMLLDGFFAFSACLVVVAAAFGFSVYAFATFGIWLPISVPLLIQLPLAILLGALEQYLWQRRLSERLRSRVGSFLPDRVVRHLTSQQPPEQLRELLYGVCVFVDLRGYTSASEGLAPEALATSTSRYYALVDHAVENSKSRGEVIRHSGDGAIALWDTRRFSSHREMRLAACNAALEIRDEIARSRNETSDLNLPVSIGVHEGEYLQGMLGERNHLEHTVLGNSINTTARIEGLNKHLGTSLLASGDVVKKLGDVFLLRPLGKFQLAGKAETSEVFEIMQRGEQSSAREIDLANRFSTLWQEYDRGRWSAVIRVADEILENYPDDGPTRFFKQRAELNLATQNVEIGSPVVMDRK